ncbi:MAG: hypothetical protein R2812_05250 [Gelidibacter sp.]
MKTINILFIGVALMSISCSNSSESDLIDNTEIPNLVTYTSDVKPIISNNCISCHTNPPENGAPMSLLMYNNVKDAILNRGLINRISSEDLGFLMPFGGPRLPQNLIDVIIQWEADGLLEN